MSKFKILTISTVIAIIVITLSCFAILLLLSVPNGDAIEEAMEKKDFITLADISSSTPVLGLLLPEGANRSLSFTKSVNLDMEVVRVVYFNDYKSLQAYKDGLELSEGQVALSRAKALFIGAKEETTKARWMLWA